MAASVPPPTSLHPKQSALRVVKLVFASSSVKDDIMQEKCTHNAIKSFTFFILQMFYNLKNRNMYVGI